MKILHSVSAMTWRETAEPIKPAAPVMKMFIFVRAVVVNGIELGSAQD